MPLDLIQQKLATILLPQIFLRLMVYSAVILGSQYTEHAVSPRGLALAGNVLGIHPTL
jgi:hypothetical protein